MKFNTSKVAILIAVAFVFPLLAICPVHAAPTLAGNGKIAFTSDRDGNSEIYLMDADGTGQTRLTNNPDREDYPTWSPDGRRIAFLRQTGGVFSINLMNADGTNQTELTTITPNNIQTYPYERFGMSWSPDGAKIAFQDSADIFTINTDGSKRVNLTGGQYINYEPTWSPDGLRIAFARSIYSHGAYPEIYTMNASGSNIRRITTSEDYCESRSPDWSPDGGRIALADCINIDPYSISLVNPDGADLQRILLFDGNVTTLVNNMPKWSPDGTKIVFYRNTYCNPVCTNSISQIWRMNRDGGELTQLTTTSPNNLHPDWQPLSSLTVTRSDDRNNANCVPGDCSLREAVNAANASPTDDTIDFASGLTTITLNDEIVINNAGALTIDGPGANVLTIDAGAGTNRIFAIYGATAAISGVTLTGGRPTNNGGAIVADGSSVTLDGLYVAGNSAGFGGGLLLVNGTSRIINSTISANAASDDGGGINFGGPLTIVNSTISGNTAYSGGGIYTDGGALTVRNSTITNNSNSGIAAGFSTVNFGNTIVAGNTNTVSPGYANEILCYCTITSAGGNLVGDSPGDSGNTGPVSIVYQPTDIRDTNPLLGPLQINGGTTSTHALQGGSPIIDKGLNGLANPGMLVTDQRGSGFSRIRDGNVDGTARVDIGAFEVQLGSTASRTTPFDYDGDGRADVSVFRPATGAWYLQRSTAGFAGISFGNSTDKITPADFDGDGKTDVAVYRPATSTWYWLNSSNGAFNAVQFGSSEDLPTSADYDGDGKADISVFRPANGTWYRLNSSDGSFYAAPFGTNGDKPTIGDFDGDGKADVAVFRPSNGAWYRLNSSNGAFVAVGFGLSTDLITPADFDGDGKTDIAVYRASTGTWYSLNSSNGGLSATQFGIAEDLPTAADYDGDGKADISVFRPSNGSWYRLNSSTGGFFAVQFGANGDRPMPGAFRY